ncbi:hypothetical protein EDB89DRAFT_2240739 [Lactarius sanguifluus]|nr:hypothetical protein EDB89DRAFT_2240739 [Lactarius sanguifluus]
MRYKWFLVLFVLSGAGPLSPSRSPSNRIVPPNWECLGHPDAEATVDLHIAFKSQHENALTEVMPSTRYRAYLSKEQVADLVALHPDTLEFINSWLGHHGVSSSMTSMTHGGSWLTLYRHSATNLTILHTINYGLPVGLHVHVKSITPTTYFGSPCMLGQTPRKCSGRGELVTTLSNRDDYVTSYACCTRWWATFPLRRTVTGSGLLMFMSEFRPEGADDVTYEVVRIKDRGYNPSNPGLEANQSIQYTAALTHHEDDHKNIPQTVTTSYGVDKDDILPDVANSVCNLFKRPLTAVGGTTVCFIAAMTRPEHVFPPVQTLENGVILAVGSVVTLNIHPTVSAGDPLPSVAQQISTGYVISDGKSDQESDVSSDDAEEQREKQQIIGTIAELPGVRPGLTGRAHDPRKALSEMRFNARRVVAWQSGASAAWLVNKHDLDREPSSPQPGCGYYLTRCNRRN